MELPIFYIDIPNILYIYPKIILGMEKAKKVPKFMYVSNVITFSKVVMIILISIPNI